jgi:hypothetical protein
MGEVSNGAADKHGLTCRRQLEGRHTRHQNDSVRNAGRGAKLSFGEDGDQAIGT